MEQTLFLCKEVDVFRIPPRQGAAGHRSGDWRVADKLAVCRLKVVAQGEQLEVRLEDVASGELFGVCPVPKGQAHVAVEQATDSSRNFVLRLEDAVSKRHAFIGISFAERHMSFDFNVALSDFEKQQRREAEMSKISAAADPLAAAQNILPEAASLYKHHDLSLKEGETIKIGMKKKSGAGEDSFLSRLTSNSSTAGSSSSSNSTGPKLMPLAPPPGEGSGPALAVLPPPPAARSAPASAAAPSAATAAGVASSSGADDLLGLGDSAAAAFASFEPFAGAASQAGTSQPAPTSAAAALAQPTVPPAATEAPDGWATFE